MSNGGYVLVMSTSILLFWLIVIVGYQAVEDWLEFRAERERPVPRVVDWSNEFQFVGWSNEFDWETLRFLGGFPARLWTCTTMPSA